MRHARRWGRIMHLRMDSYPIQCNDGAEAMGEAKGAQEMELASGEGLDPEFGLGMAKQCGK